MKNWKDLAVDSIIFSLIFFGVLTWDHHAAKTSADGGQPAVIVPPRKIPNQPNSLEPLHWECPADAVAVEPWNPNPAPPDIEAKRTWKEPTMPVCIRAF